MTNPATTQSDPSINQFIDAARDVWIKRLIDHSRANSLLFYRDLKTGTLDLSSQGEAVMRLMSGESLSVDALISPPVENEDVSCEVLLAGANERSRIKSSLTAIKRKAQTNLEEKGIDTLFLAAGLATWPADDGGRPYASPVILFPARIDMRNRSGDEYKISLAGEPNINPTLLHMLADSYDIAFDGPSLIAQCIGGVEEDAPLVNTDHVYELLLGGAQKISGFQIVPRFILANFQFAKIAMVEDLKRSHQAMLKSPIISAIAGHPASRQSLAQGMDDFAKNDLERRAASEDFLVLDADETQHLAILRASKGQHGVIQGPPGTGKSQTISNLIAQSVAEGKRVLFVAEKRAALDAVIKRLAHPDVGLGHLILDLHGAAVSRKEIMAKVNQALHHIRVSAPAANAETIHRLFTDRRNKLNDHARRINQVRKPTDLSMIQMIGRVLRLPEPAKSALRIRSESLLKITPEAADEIKQCLIEGAANPELFLGQDKSPWNRAHIMDGASAQKAVDAAARASRSLWPEFMRLLEQVTVGLDIAVPDSLNAVAGLLMLLYKDRSIRSAFSPEIYASNPAGLAEALVPASGNVFKRLCAFMFNSDYRAARTKLKAMQADSKKRISDEILRQNAKMAAQVLGEWAKYSPSSTAISDVPNYDILAKAYDSLIVAVQELESILKGHELGVMPIAGVGALLQALAADQRTPYRLVNVLALDNRLRELGLANFIDELRQNHVAPEYWVPRFEYVWLHSAIDHVLVSEPALAAFNGRTHEQIVADFIKLDVERTRLSAERVRRLHAERAITAMNEHYQQTDLVRSEANKKGRHIPVRELLIKAPDVLTRIAPCWVASPLSVSQLLDAGRRYFDIVVFDEASQILQEEAIPALFRAEQVIVAGDRHQLPPTTFFGTAIDGMDGSSTDASGDDDLSTMATKAVGGYESLLDTMNAFLPTWMLEWHYRSEDERLITFSNYQVYSGRLITFPNPHIQDAIRHVLVPHDPSLGGQEESASREVEEVVRQVINHAESRPDESLGVITMGIKHANRVQAALDQALESRPDLSAFFSMDREGRFFVKNIETVQGDERDAIILSVGYGKSASGDLPHRFGPLTQDVGYRRLNVAVTRAKRRMCVISSFSHDDIDLNRSGGRGVQMLKAYLQYASSGGARLAEAEKAGEVALNAFEADIHDALVARGLTLRSQFGASHYRIDLVAMHPEKRGRPVLAIECDGATYHSNATARVRDRLRQSHLQRLGWRFHRIWSTDWFYGREVEIERAIAAYEDAVRVSNLKESAENASNKLSADNDKEKICKPPHVVTRIPKPSVTKRESIDHYSDIELRKLLDWISSDGLLRTDDELIQELFHALPFSRKGSKIKERLASIVVGHKNIDSYK